MYLPRAIGLEGGSSEPDTCENLRREELYQSMNWSDRCSIGMKEGQSEPAGTSKLAKRRTVETNKMKRLMYIRSVRGAIWARQYLLKASKAKLEVSTATKARLAGACPKYRPIIHRSLSLQWLQFLASKDIPNSLPSSWKTMPEAGRAEAIARRIVESERRYPERILPA